MRLAEYARLHWDVTGHVIPYPVASETLQESIRSTSIEYFERHNVKWWTSRRDRRTSDMLVLPTGHLSSSQVACVNHLEAARIDQAVANRIIRNLDSSLTAQRVDDGFVDYEWIGADSYLGESRLRVRGANVTSLDAIMCGGRELERTLVAIEWKYLETYGVHSIAVSDKGTNRVAIYRSLLEDPDCPIEVEELESLFFEPYYQLMRQTLLAWQMVKHSEFGATDWIHVYVVPDGNVALLHNKSAPNLRGETTEEKWRSVLKRPERFHLVSPTHLVHGTGSIDGWTDWRTWLQERYRT
jgi:hypothetical protein